MRKHSLIEDPGERALTRLDALVRHLSRLHNRQYLSRYLLDALFWGLLLAALAVLILRLTHWSYPLQGVVAVCVLLVLGGALLLAWYRLPDTLAVVIEADQQLKLKQRLSTAWEFRQARPDSALTRTLAIQAAGRRLPATSAVFNFRPNLWGMLLPLAFALLLLAATLDLQRAEPVRTASVDMLLSEEGIRLKAFARRMQRRAGQQSYPRSESVAQDLQGLGSRMQTSAFDRTQALSALQQAQGEIVAQRTEVLNRLQGLALPGAADQAENQWQHLNEQQLGELRQRLASGTLTPQDLQALDSVADALRDSGVSAGQLREALDRYAGGSSRQLQQLLEDISDAGVYDGEARELAKARRAVSRARANLGDDEVGEQEIVLRQQGRLSKAEASAESTRNFALGEFPGDYHDDGAGWNRIAQSRPPERSSQSTSQLSDYTQADLQVRSRRGSGESFSATTRALPQAGTSAAQRAEVDVRFARQMEAVLGKDNYPLHRKEYVRRYFLNLGSAGYSAPEEQQADDR